MFHFYTPKKRHTKKSPGLFYSVVFCDFQIVFKTALYSVVEFGLVTPVLHAVDSGSLSQQWFA